MSELNVIRNLAIVGAGGTIGSYITKALIVQGRHNVTALTRPESGNILPAGLQAVKKVDYSDQNALTGALEGQDALVITLPSQSSPKSQEILIDAAVEAGVKYIMTNDYGVDLTDEKLAHDTIVGARALAVRKYIEEKSKGKTYWIALSSGFWYEHSLAGSPRRFGFDFDKKILEMFDEGRSKICTSTWVQSGDAVAKLFALKVRPDGPGDESLTLAQFENKALFIKSFTVSQQDMFESILRVTDDKESDWAVTHESSKRRYERGKKMFEEGQAHGLVMMLYTRVFYPDGGGNFSQKASNAELGLKIEDLDAATRNALQLRAKGHLRG